MSKEYEKELEKTIEHLHKVIEEKTTLIDQQKEMLDKFISGDISINQMKGYVDAPSYVGVSTGPLNGSGSFGQPSYTGYKTVSQSSDDPDIDKPDTSEPL